MHLLEECGAVRFEILRLYEIKILLFVKAIQINTKCISVIKAVHIPKAFNQSQHNTFWYHYWIWNYSVLTSIKISSSFLRRFMSFYDEMLVLWPN